MAGPDRPTQDAVIAKLAEQPHAFGFYAAVRLLQSCFPDLPRVGYSTSPQRDPVRLGQSPALDFAPATLESAKAGKNGAAVLYTRHFGLFGPHGPLPLCFTEYARDRILHHGDSTFAAFCNVFHHRLLSFFFRTWADAQKAVDADRPGDAHWSRFVGSMIGLGMESLLQRQSVPDRAKYFFAGHLARQTRNAEGLEAIVQDYFGIRTQLQSFVGRWLTLPPGSVCKLGASPETGLLGSTVIVGERFWSCQLHFRVRMGPMNLLDYERMLPTGHSYRRLCDWVRLYTSEHYSWDLQLTLAKEEVPRIQIGKAGRLGWTTWLKTQPFTRDADQLVMLVQAEPSSPGVSSFMAGN